MTNSVLIIFIEISFWLTSFRSQKSSESEATFHKTVSTELSLNLQDWSEEEELQKEKTVWNRINLFCVFVFIILFSENSFLSKTLRKKVFNLKLKNLLIVLQSEWEKCEKELEFNANKSLCDSLDYWQTHKFVFRSKIFVYFESSTTLLTTIAIRKPKILETDENKVICERS